jgi:hypothetical protein
MVVVVLFPAGTREFYPKRPDRVTGPPNLFFNGYWGFLSPGIKRPVREAGNLLPSSAKIKKARNYSSFSPYAFLPCTEITLPYERNVVTLSEHFYSCSLLGHIVPDQYSMYISPLFKRLCRQADAE